MIFYYYLYITSHSCKRLVINIILEIIIIIYIYFKGLNVWLTVNKLKRNLTIKVIPAITFVCIVSMNQKKTK